MFQSVPKEKAVILQSGVKKYACSNCGMRLPKTYKTNHAATVEGEIKQFCSMRCLSKAKTVKKMPMQNIQAVNTISLDFIDAHSAFYVVGSKKKGTMSRVSKYAFASEAEAEAFVRRYGGEVVSFDGAFEMALKDFKKRE